MEVERGFLSRCETSSLCDKLAACAAVILVRTTGFGHLRTFEGVEKKASWRTLLYTKKCCKQFLAFERFS